MIYQDLIDFLSIDMNIDSICKIFYEKVRENLPDKIYKYYSLNDDSELNNSKLKCLMDEKVYLSNRKDFNDPYDDYGYVYDQESVITYASEIGMKWNLNNIYPDFKIITCFTKSGVDNFAMWAHYANNHQGYCVEYNLKENYELCSMILPVQYVDKKIDLTKMIKIRLKFVKQHNNVKLLEDALTFCAIFMSCIKHKTWSYEDEVRLIYPANFDCKQYFDALPSKIYIGSKCCEKYTKRLVEIGNNLHIDVYKMKVSRKKIEYKLESDLLYKMK